MSKHVDLTALSRDALIRRYARLRSVSLDSARGITNGFSRTELRSIVERIEGEFTAPRGKRAARSAHGQTTTIQGITR